MKAKHLAEAVILQSIEDLWIENRREECIRFFSGEDFRTCAAIAELDTADQIKILNMLGGLIKTLKKPLKTKKKESYGYAFPQHELNRELIRT